MSIIKDVRQLNIGDYVAIYDRIRPWPREVEVSEDSVVLVDWQEIRGWPLEVLAISVPFIMCKLRIPGFPRPFPFLVELDRFQICRVNARYMKSFCDPN
jgi:hypothetical protein